MKYLTLKQQRSARDDDREYLESLPFFRIYSPSCVSGNRRIGIDLNVFQFSSRRSHSSHDSELTSLRSLDKEIDGPFLVVTEVHRSDTLKFRLEKSHSTVV